MTGHSYDYSIKSAISALRDGDPFVVRREHVVKFYNTAKAARRGAVVRPILHDGVVKFQLTLVPAASPLRTILRWPGDIDRLVAGSGLVQQIIELKAA